jgi:PhzF family phenazine biosynthesis protein
MLPSLTYKLLPSSDIPLASSIEAAGYPADEAASPASLSYRQEKAPQFFQGAYSDAGELVGYVCSTLCSAFTHDALDVHDPAGPILAIHSVCVAEQYRRRGVATAMLRHFVRRVVSSQPTVSRISLMAKMHLIPFYRSCGFECRGLSPIVHGQDPWFDLSMSLAPPRRPAFSVVSAFASKLGEGNPAAVVLLPPGKRHADYPDAWLQAQAAEFNLSETVFVAGTDAPAAFELAYFSPTTEVGLCGHATLASAAVLFGDGLVDRSAAISFQTRAGQRLEARWDGGAIEMQLPLNPPSELDGGGGEGAELLGLVRSVFGIAPEGVVRLAATQGNQHGVVELTRESFEAVARVGSLDLSPLLAASAPELGVILCCEGGERGVHFSSRFFVPKLGIPEDPVTGSAHAVLAPFFGAKLGKTKLKGFQASDRGGEVGVEVAGDVCKITGSFFATSTGTIVI